MIKWYIDNNRDVKLLKKTVSCFSPIHTLCGECSACFRRWIAFEWNGIHEKYSKDITKWEGIQNYVTKMKNGEYDDKRTKQTMDVLKEHGLI